MSIYLSLSIAISKFMFMFILYKLYYIILFVIWACSIPNNFYKTRLPLASSMDSCGLASFLGATAVSSSLPLNLNTDKHGDSTSNKWWFSNQQ